MPNYSVAVSSDDNMVITKAASESGLTAEQYLKQMVRNHAEKLKANP